MEKKWGKKGRERGKWYSCTENEKTRNELIKSGLIQPEMVGRFRQVTIEPRGWDLGGWRGGTGNNLMPLTTKNTGGYVRQKIWTRRRLCQRGTLML